MAKFRLQLVVGNHILNEYARHFVTSNLLYVTMDVCPNVFGMKNTMEDTWKCSQWFIQKRLERVLLKFRMGAVLDFHHQRSIDTWWRSHDYQRSIKLGFLQMVNTSRLCRMMKFSSNVDACINHFGLLKFFGNHSSECSVIMCENDLAFSLLSPLTLNFHCHKCYRRNWPDHKLCIHVLVNALNRLSIHP